MVWREASLASARGACGVEEVADAGYGLTAGLEAVLGGGSVLTLTYIVGDSTTALNGQMMQNDACAGVLATPQRASLITCPFAFANEAGGGYEDGVESRGGR